LPHDRDLSCGSRRVLLGGALAAGTTDLLAPASPAAATAPALVRGGRPLLSSGVASGDVMTSSAVLWARSDRPARLVATLHGPRGTRRRVRDQWAGRETDLTARIELHGLRPGS